MKKLLIFVLLAIITIVSAQNLKNDQKHQQNSPLLGQQEFNPTPFNPPYQIYQPFEIQQKESQDYHNHQKDQNQSSDYSTTNKMLFYGSIIGVGLLAFILVKSCCCQNAPRRYNRTNQNYPIQRGRPIHRQIPQARIYYSQPKNYVIENSIQTGKRPIHMKENYPVSALDKQIQFHRKHIERLQKQKNLQIKKRQQEQKLIKQRQQQTKKQEQLKALRQKQIREQQSYQEEMRQRNSQKQMEMNYYGYHQNFGQHPMMRNQPVIYQPSPVVGRSMKEQSAQHIAFGQKEAFQRDIYQPIPKKDNDSSFASEYPEI